MKAKDVCNLPDKTRSVSPSQLGDLYRNISLFHVIFRWFLGLAVVEVNQVKLKCIVWLS